MGVIITTIIKKHNFLKLTMEKEEILEEAGLTKNEAKIYHFLLLQSKAKITDIAKRTGVHRRSVYDVLMRLSDKGLVSYLIEGGTKVYFPNDPKKLPRILEEKKQKIEKAMPDLEALFKKRTEKKSTQFFAGKKSVRNILDRQLEQKDEILIIGGSTRASEILKEYFPRYNLIRKEKKIPMKIIYSGKDYKKPPKLPLCKTKLMPKGKGGDIAINIYGDNVALFLWNLEAPFVILIHQKEVADSFRDYFDYIWNSL